MVLKDILLRLSQIVAASSAIYLLLIAGTLFFQVRLEEMSTFLIYSGLVWIVWAVLTFFIVRSSAEFVREVAIVVYPGGALISLILSVISGYYMESMLQDPQREIWTFILAGVLIAIVLIIKCFDIQWMRSADDLMHKNPGPNLDDEYGPML